MTDKKRPRQLTTAQDLQTGQTIACEVIPPPLAQAWSESWGKDKNEYHFRLDLTNGQLEEVSAANLTMLQNGIKQIKAALR